MNTRKQIRLQNFDYSNNGAYFVTICTNERKCVLGTIPKTQNICVGQGLCSCRLSDIGIVVDEEIRNLTSRYKYIEIQKYVIMPNHIHIMLFVSEDGASRTSPPTRQHSVVSQFVSTFKRFCNKEYGCNIWQRHFNDHIIRNRKDYEEHLRYIYENPTRWYYDELYAEE